MTNIIVPSFPNSMSAVQLALNYPDLDIRELEEVIDNTHDVVSAIRFAECVPAADIQRLQEVVVTFGNCSQLLNFASTVENADVLLIARTIAGSDCKNDKEQEEKSMALQLLQQQFSSIITLETFNELNTGVML